MKSLFEKEERKAVIDRLKIDLISRFYPFSKEEVLKYKSILNFGYNQLMSNEQISWDTEMLDNLCDNVDWSAIHKIQNLHFDKEFFKKYESKIDFRSIHFSKNIKWSNDLLIAYGDRFDWSSSLITKKPLSKIENLRRYKDRLNWGLVSERINIDFNDNNLEEFADRWDWKKLSLNRNLPVTVEFIKKHIDQLDFDVLSQNPRSLELILKYPSSKRWNWEMVILNPAITYNRELFEFLFIHYKKQYESKEFTNPFFKRMALNVFLFSILSKQQNDVSYFLNDSFIKYLPWANFCKFCNTKLTLEFIEKHKDKLNFKESEFIRVHRDVITTEFMYNNSDLFNSEHYPFYYLPLTIELLKKFEGKINWNKLSRSEKLDWNWGYINENHNDLNFFLLAENKGIYEKLINEKCEKKEILEFLNMLLAKK